MTIQHAGFTIPGTHEAFQWGQWQRARQSNSVFGLDGETVLDGGRVQRPFTVPILINNDFTQGALLSLLGQIEQRIGTQGTFVESGDLSRSLENIELHSLEIILDALPSSQLGWFVEAKLHFIQLSP